MKYNGKVCEMSKRKVEDLAVNAVRSLLDDIACVSHDLHTNDRGVSWDGSITLYNSNNIDKKENFSSIVNVQIKGRTCTAKKLGRKTKFQVDKADLVNYLKVGGTVFFLYKINKNNSKIHKLYVAYLLPYDIRQYLSTCQPQANKVPIKLKEVVSPGNLEYMLYNFANDSNMQSKISDIVFGKSIGEPILERQGSEDHHQLIMSISKLRDPFDLVGNEKFIYRLDNNGNITALCKAPIDEISKARNMQVKDKSGRVFFKNIAVHLDKNNRHKISFGRAIVLNVETNTFKIFQRGSLNERINDLEFIKTSYNDGYFYIGDIRCAISTDDLDVVSNRLSQYKIIRQFLANCGMVHDIQLDELSNNDINGLSMWATAEHEHTMLKLNIDSSAICTVEFGTIALPIFVEKAADGEFYVYSLWKSPLRNSTISYKYRNTNKMQTSNFLLFLNKSIYASDGVDFDKLRTTMARYGISNHEAEPANMQALEAIKCYDETGNTEALNYAEFLLSLISKSKCDADAVFINTIQIKKRKGTLTKSDMRRLNRIKDNTSDTLALLSIHIITEEFAEARGLLNDLDEDTRAFFMQLPVYNLYVPLRGSSHND